MVLFIIVRSQSAPPATSDVPTPEPAPAPPRDIPGRPAKIGYIQVVRVVEPNLEFGWLGRSLSNNGSMRVVSEPEDRLLVRYLPSDGLFRIHMVVSTQ